MLQGLAGRSANLTPKLRNKLVDFFAAGRLELFKHQTTRQVVPAHTHTPDMRAPGNNLGGSFLNISVA
jgi:hypothetical protein